MGRLVGIFAVLSVIAGWSLLIASPASAAVSCGTFGSITGESLEGQTVSYSTTGGTATVTITWGDGGMNTFPLGGSAMHTWTRAGVFSTKVHVEGTVPDEEGNPQPCTSDVTGTETVLADTDRDRRRPVQVPGRRDRHLPGGGEEPGERGGADQHRLVLLPPPERPQLRRRRRERLELRRPAEDPRAGVCAYAPFIPRGRESRPAFLSVSVAGPAFRTTGIIVVTSYRNAFHDCCPYLDDPNRRNDVAFELTQTRPARS